MPTNSRCLSSSRDRAVTLPRGDIVLKFCRACGLVFNSAFDPGLIADRNRADEIEVGSPIYTAFERHLADQLIERYGLRGKSILEVGYGRGELVQLLCDRGINRRAEPEASSGPGPPQWQATTEPRLLHERMSGTATLPADLVCGQGSLQEVAELAPFLGSLKDALRGNTRLFLQVDNFARTLRHVGFWEIDYTSCSYFSPGTMYRLLQSGGFVVSEVWTDFEAEYLMADVHTASPGATQAGMIGSIETLGELEVLVARFAQECREKQALWCEILRKLARAGNRIAVWGAGSRTVSFLTTLAVGDEVSYVVDMNSGRQGKFTPGTGHRIVGPDAMTSLCPDVVIVMNSVFAFEIRDALTRAGCAPTLLIA